MAAEQSAEAAAVSSHADERIAVAETRACDAEARAVDAEALRSSAEARAAALAAELAEARAEAAAAAPTMAAEQSAEGTPAAKTPAETAPPASAAQLAELHALVDAAEEDARVAAARASASERLLAETQSALAASEAHAAASSEARGLKDETVVAVAKASAAAAVVAELTEELEMTRLMASAMSEELTQVRRAATAGKIEAGRFLDAVVAFGLDRSLLTLDIAAGWASTMTAVPAVSESSGILYDEAPRDIEPDTPSQAVTDPSRNIGGTMPVVRTAADVTPPEDAAAADPAVGDAEELATDAEMYDAVTYALGTHGEGAAAFLFEGRLLAVENEATAARLDVVADELAARSELAQATAELQRDAEQHSIRRAVAVGAAALDAEHALGARGVERDELEQRMLLHQVAASARDAAVGQERVRLLAEQTELLRAQLASVVAAQQNANTNANPSASPTTTRGAATTPTRTGASSPVHGSHRVGSPSGSHGYGRQHHDVPSRPARSAMTTSPTPTSRGPTSAAASSPAASQRTPARSSRLNVSRGSPMTSMPSSLHSHARSGHNGPGSIAGVLHDMAYQRNESGHVDGQHRRAPVPSANMARAIVIAQQLERDESARTGSSSPPR
jgi:SWI/SNF-related matrix-associated actin-dependent regulator 1 of chromatin subfamily A